MWTLPAGPTRAPQTDDPSSPVKNFRIIAGSVPVGEYLTGPRTISVA